MHFMKVRIEKFYAFWGQDLDSHTTPMECGRGFRCKMKSDIPFIGKLVKKFTSNKKRINNLSLLQRNLNLLSFILPPLIPFNVYFEGTICQEFISGRKQNPTKITSVSL